LVGFVLLVSHRSAYTFSITNRDNSKSANISQTIQIMRGAGQYPIHANLPFIAKRLQVGNSLALNLEYA
jgi:hypothetical protein